MRPWVHVDRLLTRAAQPFPLIQKRLNLGNQVGLELIDSGLGESAGQQLPPLVVGFGIPVGVNDGAPTW